MQFSYRWLCDYVDLPEDPETIARALTRVGLAVDHWEERRLASGIDFVFEVEVTTNRPDAMCHVGLAREAALALDLPLRLPAPGEAGDPGPDAAAGLGARVLVEDPALCPRFTARVIDGVKVGPSPSWLVERLAAVGLRAINNVVDVTNYLLWEWGQPQHAYDLATLAEQTIVVRRAGAGETLVTLDGVERQLDEEMLLICDAAHPIGVAGVMGGRDTEVTESTRSVLLESAFFDPKSVRRTARQLALHTDASHRFERGADWDLALRANDRACRLIAELTGGTVRPASLDVRSEGHLPRPRTILLEPRKLVAFAGAEIESEQASRWLGALGFEVDRSDAERWRVVPPTWRLYDVELAPDLYEEVIRHYGYDRVPTTLPALAGADAPESAAQKRRRLVRRQLVASGFYEAINWAFHSPAEDRGFPLLAPGGGPPVRLANPLSERYSVMRRSLLPGLHASALYNVRRGAEAVRLFEIGHLFGAGEGDDEGPSRADREVEAVGLIAGGHPLAPWQGRSGFDLFHLKGVLEGLAEALSTRLEARPATLPGLLQGASAELFTEQEGRLERLGYLGQLDLEDVPYPLFAGELLLAALGSEELLSGARLRTLAAPSRFPSIGADLTLTHSLAVSWQELTRAIEEHRSAGGVPELLSYELKDRYQGKGVPAGAVNTTIGFLYSLPERSLTQEEVNLQHAALTRFLEQRYSWRDEGDPSGQRE